MNYTAFIIIARYIQNKKLAEEPKSENLSFDSGVDLASTSFEPREAFEDAEQPTFAIMENDKTFNAEIESKEKFNAEAEATKPYNRGLLQFKRFWEKTVVDIYIGGEVISGTPVFIENDSIRVINKMHSYFIPLDKIDFIRTSDGLSFSS